MNEKIVVVTEKSKLDPSEIKRRYTEIPYTPGSIRKVLGPNHALRLMKILTSDEAIEGDWLFACGEITQEQRDQYMDATGIRVACSSALTGLARDIAQYVKPKLPLLVAREGRGERRETLTEIVNAVSDLCSAKIKPFEGTSSAISSIAFEFFNNLLAFIGADLIELLGNDAVNRDIQLEAQKILNRYREWSQREFGIDFQGYQFYQERFFYEATLSDSKNLMELDTLLDFTHSYTGEERNALEKEKNMLIAHVMDEAVYKKIPLVTLNENGPQVILRREGENEKTERYGKTLGSVIINFVHDNPTQFPNFVLDPYGHPYCDYGLQDNVVSLIINPTNGDLDFITGGVPISDLIGNDRYLALQVYVLKGLRTYLDSKDPDIEDLFLDVPTQEIQRNGVITHEEILPEQTSPEIPKEQASPDAVETTYTWGGVADDEPEVEISEVQPSSPEIVIPKHVRGLIMHKISGASADEVLSALRNLLGKEVRVVGSHHVFKSERTRKTIPIPRHSQRSRNHIALGLLLSNLKGWGYTPLELAKELGLKIPEKLLNNGGK